MNDNPSAQRIDWFDLAKGVAIILYVDMNFRRYGNALMFYAGGLSGTLLVMKLSMLTTDGKIVHLYIEMQYFQNYLHIFLYFYQVF